MESHLLQYVSDKESSMGDPSSIGGGVSRRRRRLPPPPSSVLQCWDCFRLFSSEAALIQHLAQTNLLCTFAAKALFLERLKQKQQQQEAAATIPKMPYHHQFELDTEEGTGTNDPFGDGNVTLDLVSPMDHYYDFVGNNNNNGKYRASNAHHQDLDLELKL